MQSLALLSLGAALVTAQYNPPPPPVLLTTTKSGVLPVLPTPFNGVETLEGAIINKGPANPAYTPVYGPASAQSNLPAATYTATLPSIAFDALTGTTISGTITGSSNQGALGVTFNVNFANFPDFAQYGPFVYHIHDQPVPADGNCTSTMGHLDTTNAGEYYPCIISASQNCQIGDLAGKHGMITQTPFTASYVDPYLSTDPSSSYFFGAKSIVIHTANTTRLTCANFQMSSGGNSTNGTIPSAGSPTASATTSAPAMYTGGASKVVTGSAVGVLAAIFGLMM